MNARLISRNLHTNTRIWPRRYRQTRLSLTRSNAQMGVVVIASRFGSRCFELEG